MTTLDMEPALLSKMGRQRFTLRDMERFMDAWSSVIHESLRRGEEKIKIKGLGMFHVRELKERQARNPKTGEMLRAPARTKLVFRMDSAMKKVMAHVHETNQ